MYIFGSQQTERRICCFSCLFCITTKAHNDPGYKTWIAIHEGFTNYTGPFHCLWLCCSKTNRTKREKQQILLSSFELRTCSIMSIQTLFMSFLCEMDCSAVRYDCHPATPSSALARFCNDPQKIPQKLT